MSYFDLEKAVQSWRNKLHKYSGIEPGDIEEFEDHLRNTIEEMIQNGHSPEEAFNTVISRDWKNLKDVSKEFTHMRFRPTNQSLSLLNNFLKVSFRSLRKRWTYSAINLFGLIVGLTSVFGISIYVVNELSYDRFHENGKEIHRVVNLFKKASGQLHYPLAPPALAPTVGTNLTGIKRVTRLRRTSDMLLEFGNNKFIESTGFYADSSFLKMFTFPLSQGDYLTALDAPNSIVLTDALAKKYFGNENPMGKILTFDDTRTLKVTGIIEEVPSNSHFQFDYLISFETYIVPDGYLADLTSWGWVGFLTYFQLEKNADVEELERLLTETYKSYNTSSVYTDIEVTLQALSDIYLYSNHLGNPDGNMFATNSEETVFSLMAVAFLILFIASFNYLNITLVSFQTRFKELGIRQVMGSGKSKLLIQLILESVIVVCLAGIVALTIAFTLLKMNFGEINVDGIINFQSIGLAFGFLLILSILLGLITGTAAGSSMVQSKTLDLLKGQKLTKSKKGHFRYSMLLVQFFISAGLIMLSIIIGNQINYMNEKSLGYEKEGIIVLAGIREHMAEHYEQLQDRFANNPAILSSARSNHVFEGGASGNSMRFSNWPVNQSMQTAYFQVGYDFPEVVGLNLLQGRFFSRDIASDSTHSVIINETAAKALGIETLENQKILFTRDDEMEIIGIVEDFHFRSLHHEITPLALVMPFTNPKYMAIKYKTNNLPQLIDQIESSWEELNQGKSEITISFLDDVLASQYQKDYYFSGIIQLFTVLAIFIACLGLWGLTSIAINLKLKQISIRKVLGAQPKDILLSIGKTFLIAAMIGTLISWPIVYLISNDWLESFAYHVEPSFLVLVQSIVLITVISLATLFAQYYKIVKTNPATILQNDN